MPSERQRLAGCSIAVGAQLLSLFIYIYLPRLSTAFIYRIYLLRRLVLVVRFLLRLIGLASLRRGLTILGRRPSLLPLSRRC